jgi:MerR family copper efflux transcriptional regulator
LNLYRWDVSAYTIGQIADRSGFSTSALRYYEGIGLLAPSGRSPGGYRLYDEHTLSQLTFIARAKRLGCSLDEIVELIAIWNGQRCGPVQSELHRLVTAKLREAERQARQLGEFTAQLRLAGARLSGEPVDGPCDDGCACAREDPECVMPVVLGAKPEQESVVIACSLTAVELEDRLGAWEELLLRARRKLRLATGRWRVEFDEDTDVAPIARLAALEHKCCRFFQFAVTIDARGIALEVDAGPDGADLVTALVGGAP